MLQSELENVLEVPGIDFLPRSAARRRPGFRVPVSPCGPGAHRGAWARREGSAVPPARGVTDARRGERQETWARPGIPGQGPAWR